MSAAVEGPTRSLRQEWDPETTPRPTSTSSRQTLVEEADAEYELLRQHESERLERLATTVKAVPATPTDVEDMSLLDELFFGPSTSAAGAGGNSPGSPNVAAVFANLPGIETVELERAARRHVDQSIPLLATREQFLRQLGIDTKETIHPDTGCSVMDVDDAHRAYFGHPEDAALAAFLRALVKPIDDPEWLKVSEFADEETAKDCQRIRHAEERRRERSASPPQIDEDLEDCTPVKRQLVQTFRHTHPQSPNRTQTNATLASLVVPLHEVGGESPRWVLDLTTSINPDQQPPLATASNSHDVSPPSTATKYASRTTGLNHEPLPALPLAPPLHGIDSGNNMMGGGLATYPQTSTPLRPTKPSYASSSGPSSHPASSQATAESPPPVTFLTTQVVSYSAVGVSS